MCSLDGVPLVHLDTGTADRAQDLIGQVVDGRYRIERIVGRGGMGTVYACRHVVVGKAFAMKVLRSGIERSEEILQRFIREAQAANAVHSRHICEMTDFGQLPNGAFFVVMELLHGMSLTRALREEKLERKDIKDVFIQIAETLDKTHRANIIHRDLKPDNVVLEHKDTGGYFVKLVDFGIAKVMENKASNLTETGVILGTPYYMSPEQARGDQLDNRSDIYALGVMMYRAFAGRLPFVADTAMGVLTRHLTQQPELPSRLADMEPTLERLILRCLEKKPVDRFQSMADVAEALRSVPDEVQSPRNNPTIDERSGALAAAQIRDAAASGKAPISMPTPTKVATPQALAARPGEPPGQVVDSAEAPPIPAGGLGDRPSAIPPPLPAPGTGPSASPGVATADTSGPVSAVVPSTGPPGSVAPIEPQVGAMSSGQLPAATGVSSDGHSPPHGMAGASGSGLYASGAVAPAATAQPDAASTGDPLPIHLQGEAATHRGVVSSRTSARSLRDPRGKPALWVGVAVVMAALGGVAAYVMFAPPGSGQATGTAPTSQPTAAPTEDEIELPEVAPWGSANPLGSVNDPEASADPEAESSAAPTTSAGVKAPPRATGGVRPPPPKEEKEEEEDEVQPEIRSPFD